MRLPVKYPADHENRHLSEQSLHPAPAVRAGGRLFLEGINTTHRFKEIPLPPAGIMDRWNRTIDGDLNAIAASG